MTTQTQSYQKQQQNMLQSSIASRYASLDPSKFSDEVERVWAAISDVKETVTRNVAEGNLRPIDGIRTLACMTGGAFGYEEFHPRSGQNDVLQQQAWQSLLKSQQ